MSTHGLPWALMILKPRSAILLPILGKRIVHQADYGCAGRSKTMVSTVPGIVTQDYRFKNANRENQSVLFEYLAFDISYDEYRGFCQKMRGWLDGLYQDLDKETLSFHDSVLYYPNASDSPTFQLMDIKDVPFISDVASQPLNTQLDRLGFWDNCRHTTVEFLKHGFNRGDNMASFVSYSALKGFACQATYHSETINGAFLTVPVLPEKNSIDPTTYQALSLIQRHLVQIPKIKPTDSVTIKKFNATKSLFLAIQNNPSLAKDTLTTWHQTNQKLIQHCRWFKVPNTKTEQMVKKLTVKLD